MIEVNQLSKSYGGIRAVDNISFSVKKGEVVGFLGPNGAGKSTTMKIITGFMAPTSGSAVVSGFDVFDNPIEVKKRIGYLPETPPLYSDMRVADYLRYVAELKLVPKEKISQGVQRAIEKTNLGEVSRRLIQNLSKGFRQRVGIAQALVSDPEVLILDEPTVGLDPKQVAEIRVLIKELRGQHTIILSTHILPEVEASCERIIIINSGKIVAQDTIENLSHLSRGGARIELKVRRSGADFINQLKSIPGVTRVAEGSLPHQLFLDMSALGNGNGSDQATEKMIETVAQVVIAKQAGLLEIRLAKEDLEDIFLSLTYGKEAQA